MAPPGTDAPVAPVASIVVALDESPSSRAALAWAAGYARLTGKPLYAMHVVRYDFGAPESFSPGLRGVMHTVSGPALTFTREFVSDMFEAERGMDPWALTFLNGSVGPETVRFAEHAALLVVGTREHRGVDRILVGSTSHYCLSHASCPVLAVPPPLVDVSGIGAKPADRLHR